MKTIVERANFLFLQQLVKTPAGRVHLLAQVADAEATGEVAVFEKLAQLSAEPELQKLIRRHAADEVEHGARFSARIAELGVPRPTLPRELNLAITLDDRLGVLSGPLNSPKDVMRAYAFLQVLEERVVWQFKLFVEVLAPVDLITAELFQDIQKDEERHLLYCQAITKRYAPSAAVLDATFAQFRAAESAAFAANGNASLLFILNEGLLDEPAVVRAAWRVLGAFSRLSQRVDPATDDQRFEHSQESEPHRERRRRLLAQHPGISALFGYDRRTIAVTLAVAIAHVGIAALLAFNEASALLMVIAAYTVGAIGSHWLGQTIHETSHRLAARTPLANRVLAWFANAPMVLPIAETFHRYHLEHHVHLGTVSRDSDLPLPLELDLVGKGRLAKFVWLALYPIVYFARGARSAKGVTVAEGANMAFMVLINLVLWKTLGPMGFAYLALSTFFGHGLHPVAAHFIHEHSLFAGRQETSSYYGPLNHVTFNVGFHVEHHDFMNIPGSRLPEYRALVGGEYRNLVSHDSWTCVLANFIASRQMGPASRLVRAPRDGTTGSQSA